jgi:4-amino-4-deoxy-L-arabinose transferase-like glycosyltransferase
MFRRTREGWEPQLSSSSDARKPAAGIGCRDVVVLLVLCGAFVEALRLLGIWPALVGFLLIAFDPFYLGLSRLLHPSGLMSTLVFLSMLAYLAYVLRGRRWADLLFSGLSAGLAWLSESPALFLFPFILMLAVIEIGSTLVQRRRLELSVIWRYIWPFLAWGAAGLAVYFIFWPAMWLHPIETFQRVLGQASEYAQEGHTSDVFFDGRIITTDERKAFTEQAGKFLYPVSYLGRRFYPVNYLWRTTPVILVGLVLLLPGLVFYWRRNSDRTLIWTVLALLLFALSFTLFMSFGSKKFDRYLLPVFLPLNLAAGTGLFLGASWLAERLPGRWARLAAGSVLGIAVLLQALLSIRTYPYYLSYYNSVMGGSRYVEQVMMVGWGEGLDQAARYLNTKPDAPDLRVLAQYRTEVLLLLRWANRRFLCRNGGDSQRSKCRLCGPYVNQSASALPSSGNPSSRRLSGCQVNGISIRASIMSVSTFR